VLFAWLLFAWLLFAWLLFAGHSVWPISAMRWAAWAKSGTCTEFDAVGEIIDVRE
jgi:hypothetical protein